MAKTDKNPDAKREFDEAIARFVEAKVERHLAEGGDLATLESLLHQAVDSQPIAPTNSGGLAAAHAITVQAMSSRWL